MSNSVVVNEDSEERNSPNKLLLSSEEDDPLQAVVNEDSEDDPRQAVVTSTTAFNQEAGSVAQPPAIRSPAAYSYYPYRQPRAIGSPAAYFYYSYRDYRAADWGWACLGCLGYVALGLLYCTFELILQIARGILCGICFPGEHTHTF
ncbi:hypothetical protein GOP47_0028948 [Adiantum capillus-veneris]|nr:hypothetical protein GOP47_0028948 [Adiantum capillus-veneris]